MATPSHALELVYCRTYTISVHVNLGLSSVPDGAPTTQYPEDNGQKGEEIQARKKE